MGNTILKSIAVGVIGGVIASWIKAKVEPSLQRFGEEVYPPSKKQLALKGADVTNQPENMPPSVLAEKVYHQFTGKELTKEQKIESLPYIHYGMGMFIGVAYVLMVNNNNKKLAFDGGVTAGAAIWSSTHGSVLPLLDLQGDVKDMPVSWWFWEFGSHLVFGVAMEQSRKVLNKVL
ncbi:DUF1440 domain-containing protein [Flavobacteriaceae bacterium Ap0902]|nr:DUF1440 domain-containing protein [Flavobacteriaceae bacterium Ap0902]